MILASARGKLAPARRGSESNYSKLCSGTGSGTTVQCELLYYYTPVRNTRNINGAAT